VSICYREPCLVPLRDTQSLSHSYHLSLQSHGFVNRLLMNWPFIAVAIPADAAPNLVALVELPGGHCSILGTPASTRRSVSCNDTRVGKGSERSPGPIGWTRRRVEKRSPPA